MVAMAEKTATFRTACLAAALLAASLSGCAPPPQKEPEAAAPPPPQATPKQTAAAEPLTLVPAPPGAAAKPAAKKRAPPKKRPPKPAPVVVAPPPPPSPPPPNPDEERARKRDAYLAALSKATVAFNPPSPMQLAQRAAVSLTVTPTPETAQLAADLRRSLDSNAVWSPRVRARLAGADFAIAPAEGKDFDGSKDLSAGGRTDWGWGAVPQAPGTKMLTATLSIALPPGLGGPRDLPALQRK